jgi:hypothetical protein
MLFPYFPAQVQPISQFAAAQLWDGCELQQSQVYLFSKKVTGTYWRKSNLNFQNKPAF